MDQFICGSNYSGSYVECGGGANVSKGHQLGGLIEEVVAWMWVMAAETEKQRAEIYFRGRTYRSW